MHAHYAKVPDAAARVGFSMPRRRQFNGICCDTLGSFVSRYNDLDGYWALGQYASFLRQTGDQHLQFQLLQDSCLPACSKFTASTTYYRRAVIQMMSKNEMPPTWLADACILFSLTGPTSAFCEIAITSDLGKVYRANRTVEVKPHNPIYEHRRSGSFGPSNQRCQ